MPKSGTSYVVNIDTVTDGVPYTADSANYRVLGASDAVLSDWAAVPGGSITSGKITLTIPGLTNTLAGAADEPRLVEVDVIDSTLANTKRYTIDYIVTGDTSPLVVMGNSFVTYTDALIVARDIAHDLNAWANASMDERVSAMRQAYMFISHLRFSILDDIDDEFYKDRAGWGLSLEEDFGQIYSLTEDEFNDLKPDFIQAVRRAQVVEADQYLSGEGIAAVRDSGVWSERTGEDTTTYRPSKPINMTVSPKALRYLTGYLKHTKRLTRS